MNTKNIITAYLIQHQEVVAKLNLAEPYLKLSVPRKMPEAADAPPIGDVYKLIFWDEQKGVAIYTFIGVAQ